MALDPAYGEAWSNLGLARQRLGDGEGAERCYDRALTLRPDLSLAHFNRDCCGWRPATSTAAGPAMAGALGRGRLGRGARPG
ncbi:tetratricopeptide repeat protein, partial [Azospirillum sp. B506]|uniref:tetratricopeptide repeat protein n=1 Tax=Azospirillum sp. B506 TaxID=137721 RepID=UPI001FCC4BC6